MILLQGVAGADIAAYVETLALALYLIVYQRDGAGDDERVIFEEGVTRGEGADAAGILRLVAAGSLVAEGEAEVGVPRWRTYSGLWCLCS